MIGDDHIFLGEQHPAERTLARYRAEISVILTQLESLSRDRNEYEYCKFHRQTYLRGPSQTVKRTARLPVLKRGNIQYVSQYKGYDLNAIPFSILRSPEGRYFALNNHHLSNLDERMTDGTSAYKRIREIRVIKIKGCITEVAWGSIQPGDAKGLKIFSELSSEEKITREITVQAEILDRKLTQVSVKRGEAVKSPSTISHDRKRALIMRHYHGENFLSHLTSKKEAPPLSRHDYVAVLHDVLDQVAKIHDQQWTHADIKPENIVITWDEYESRFRGILLNAGLACRQDTLVEFLPGSLLYLPLKYLEESPLGPDHDHNFVHREGKIYVIPSDSPEPILYTPYFDRYALGQIFAIISNRNSEYNDVLIKDPTSDEPVFLKEHFQLLSHRLQSEACDMTLEEMRQALKRHYIGENPLSNVIPKQKKFERPDTENYITQVTNYTDGTLSEAALMTLLQTGDNLTLNAKHIIQAINQVGEIDKKAVCQYHEKKLLYRMFRGTRAYHQHAARLDRLKRLMIAISEDVRFLNADNIQALRTSVIVRVRLSKLNPWGSSNTKQKIDSNLERPMQLSY